MFFFTDVEANGPCPGLFSMAKVGCVALTPTGFMDYRFYGEFGPINDNFDPAAYKHSNMTREQHQTFPHPQVTMRSFNKWISDIMVVENVKGRPIFISDNLAFDWQFVNYYFWRYIGSNPFGFSGRRINDIYSGAIKDLRASNEWKKFRVTVHDHNPVNDALGNAEAFWTLTKNLGIPYK